MLGFGRLDICMLRHQMRLSMSLGDILGKCGKPGYNLALLEKLMVNFLHGNLGFTP